MLEVKVPRLYVFEAILAIPIKLFCLTLLLLFLSVYLELAIEGCSSTFRPSFSEKYQPGSSSKFSNNFFCTSACSSHHLSALVFLDVKFCVLGFILKLKFFAFWFLTVWYCDCKKFLYQTLSFRKIYLINKRRKVI